MRTKASKVQQNDIRMPTWFASVTESYTAQKVPNSVKEGVHIRQGSHGRESHNGRPVADGVQAKGKILKVRMGINPNSSGHGILWGAMFFLPYSTVGSLLAGTAVGWVDEALEKYRGGGKGRGEVGTSNHTLNEDDSGLGEVAHTEPNLKAYPANISVSHEQCGEGCVSEHLAVSDTPGQFDRFLMPFLWGLSWAGFSAAWSAFLSIITLNSSLAFWTTVSLLVTVPVTFLAYQLRGNRILVDMTKKTAKLCLIGLTVAVLFFLNSLAQRFSVGLGVDDIPVIGLGISYGYLSLMAVSLTGVVLRLAGILDTHRVRVAAFLYVVLGFLFVFPVPPISTNTYNPVGLFLPFWGWLLPSVFACVGLVRMKTLKAGAGQDRGGGTKVHGSDKG